jgi:peroxiredoxin
VRTKLCFTHIIRIDVKHQPKQIPLMNSLPKVLFTIFVLSFLIESTQAQNRIVKNFTLLNAVTSQNVSLSDYANQKAIVVIFTSNYCPYSRLYEERIKNLSTEYQGKGVQFILINPNSPLSSKDDSIEEMIAKAKSANFTFPYLADKDQAVGNIFGATKTPEAFVVTNASNQYSIHYSGAIDDNPQVPSDVKIHYLKDAIDAILANRSPSTRSSRATGCMIKKK